MRPSGSFSSQENSISPGTRNAVSAIMTSAMPSIPSANWVPNAGIHSTHELELEADAGLGGVHRVGEPRQRREHDLQQRRADRDLLGRGRVAAQRVHHQGADQREHQQDGEQEVHANTTARRAPMTRTEPPSMLSAYERTKPVCSLRSRPELPPSAAAVPLTSPSTPRLSK